MSDVSGCNSALKHCLILSTEFLCGLSANLSKPCCFLYCGRSPCGTYRQLCFDSLIASSAVPRTNLRTTMKHHISVTKANSAQKSSIRFLLIISSCFEQVIWTWILLKVACLLSTCQMYLFLVDVVFVCLSRLCSRIPLTYLMSCSSHLFELAITSC